jgi:hypothetical protein
MKTVLLGLALVVLVGCAVPQGGYSGYGSGSSGSYLRRPEITINGVTKKQVMDKIAAYHAGFGNRVVIANDYGLIFETTSQTDPSVALLVPQYATPTGRMTYSFIELSEGVKVFAIVEMIAHGASSDITANAAPQIQQKLNQFKSELESEVQEKAEKQT